MLIWSLYLSILAVQILGSSANDPWYAGCFQGNGTNNDNSSITTVDGVVQCAELCLQKSVNYSGSQFYNGDILCRCFDSLDGHQGTSQDCCTQNRILSSGNAPDCWAMYSSTGPYLTHVGMEVDGRWIVVNTPVHIEIQAKVAAARNFSSDPGLSSVGNLVTVSWCITRQGAETNGTAQIQLDDDGETFHRIQHQFGTVGSYKIYVNVNNSISSLSSDLDLEVIYPEPKDLQVGIPDYHDVPSCVPDEYSLSQAQGEGVLAVFLNTSVHLEASVAMGTNLTFTFTFEDTGEVMTQSCESCTSVTQYNGQWLGRLVERCRGAEPG